MAWAARGDTDATLRRHRLALRSADAAAWGAAARRALFALDLTATRRRADRRERHALVATLRSVHFLRWRVASGHAASRGLARRRAARLEGLLVHARGESLLHALTSWYFLAALCAAAERRAAAEARLRSLQRSVAATVGGGGGAMVARAPAPTTRSMVDKMVAVIQIWEAHAAARLVAALGAWRSRGRHPLSALPPQLGYGHGGPTPSPMLALSPRGAAFAVHGTAGLCSTSEEIF